MTAHFIEWEKAGWEGTCKINYSSPSSANEEQEVQSSWVILVKIPKLDLGKVIRLCSFCLQECPPGGTVGVCTGLGFALSACRSVRQVWWWGSVGGQFSHQCSLPAPHSFPGWSSFLPTFLLAHVCPQGTFPRCSILPWTFRTVMCLPWSP